MSEQFINLTLDNLDSEHLCCAISDKKHQCGVDVKKEKFLLNMLRLKKHGSPFVGMTICISIAFGYLVPSKGRDMQKHY